MCVFYFTQKNSHVGNKRVGTPTGQRRVKREVNKRLIYECRCNGRLQGKAEGTTRRTYTGLCEGLKILSLLWIDKVSATDKTCKWVSVWWKTENWSWGIYTSHTHWVVRGTGTPKDTDEVNKREVCECDGWLRDKMKTKGGEKKYSRNWEKNRSNKRNKCNLYLLHYCAGVVNYYPRGMCVFYFIQKISHVRNKRVGAQLAKDV